MSNNYPPAKPLSHWTRFDPTHCPTTYDCQTAGQSAAIRGIGNNQRIDFESACQHLFNCKPEELCKAAARTFLDWLTKQPRQEHPSNPLHFCGVCNHLQITEDNTLCCLNGHVFEVEEVTAA